MNIREIQDALAEFENRLSYLENSQSIGVVERPTQVVAPSRSLSSKEWTELQQVKSHLLHLQEKINNLEKARRTDEQYDPF